MKTKKFIFATALVAVLFAAQSSYALVGAGFHWGFDFSRSMDDVRNEPLPTLSVPDVMDLSVSRTGFERNAINFGGKAYIDFIPILPIDAIEVSLNFGIWQYDAVLNVDLPPESPITIDPINLGLKSNGESYFGLNGMPYANMHLDFTLRRQLLNLVVLKFDAGLGYSLHMATPILDARFVEGVLTQDNFNAITAGETLDTRDIGGRVIDAMLDETLGSTAHGMHILLGVKAKLPVMPIGFYLDAKYMIPFSDSISDAKKGVNASGILLNLGVSLSI